MLASCLRRLRNLRHGRALALACAALCTVACGSGGATPEKQSCDAECADRAGFRALRETLKLVYNLTLQGNAVGEQDESTPCPEGGSAHVTGQASSNADIGTTEVELTFELDECAYLQRDDEPDETYNMTTSGTITESGILAVQPTATTAIILKSDSVTMNGTVFDPAVPFTVEACPMEAGQNGNRLAGTLCDREIAFTLN
jgi:hypothetical protein